MLRKKPTIFSILMFGVTVGISIVVIGYFAINFQRQKALESSIKGTFPKMIELADIRHYASDSDGDYYYAENLTAKKSSPENIMIWNRLVYSTEGKNKYIQKRKLNGLFVEGLENLEQRNTICEFKCSKDKAEYAVVAIFEVGKDGKTLDYGNTGKDREWGYIPPGSSLEKLAKQVCPMI